MQPVARARGARAAKKDAERIPQDLTGRIHPEFSTRGNDRFAQDLETLKASEREAEINFFSDEKCFIEPADRVEIFSSSEQKSARGKVEAKVDRAKGFNRDSRPKRNRSANRNARAAAGATILQRGDRTADMVLVNVRVGIDKEQNIAARRIRAGVAGSRNLSPIN